MSWKHHFEEISQCVFVDANNYVAGREYYDPDENQCACSRLQNRPYRNKKKRRSSSSNSKRQRVISGSNDSDEEFDAVPSGVTMRPASRDSWMDVEAEPQQEIDDEMEEDMICTNDQCINFATQTECVQCDDNCFNRRFQKRQYASLKVIETQGKGHGLFAAEALTARQFVMEYVGEIISSKEFERRRKERSNSLNHEYIMQLKSRVFIDASQKGSISRFINHSCEPNCCMEMWTVADTIRIGIFTSRPIELGEELSFDYHWKPSKFRAPTPCHCGTASCRGWLEVMTEEEIEIYCKAIKKEPEGKWRRRRGDPIGPGIAPTNADLIPENDIYDAEGQLLPDRLVGKHVKIWWDGNKAFFEAKVQDYDQETSMYQCLYLADGEVSAEPLADPSRSDWFWKDESCEDSKIQKRELIEHMEDELDTNIAVQPSSMSTSPTSGPATATNLRSFNPQIPVFIKGIVVLLDVMKHQVVQQHQSRLDSQTIFTMTHPRLFILWQRLLCEQYQVAVEASTAEYYEGKHIHEQQLLQDACIRDSGHQCLDFYAKTGNQDFFSRYVVSFTGLRTQIRRLRDSFREVAKLIGILKYQERQSINHHISWYQGSTLTRDWRFKPKCITDRSMLLRMFASNRPVTFLDHFLATILSIPAMPNDLLEVRYLPEYNMLTSQRNTPSAVLGTNAIASGNDGSKVTEGMRVTMTTHLKYLSDALDLPSTTGLRCLLLLLRYLPHTSEAVVARDNFLILAAVVWMALKSASTQELKMVHIDGKAPSTHSLIGSSTKHRSVKNIARFAYCQVFKRAIEHVPVSSLEQFLPKICQREKDIFDVLGADVFVPDVSPLLYRAMNLEITNNSKMRAIKRMEAKSNVNKNGSSDPTVTTLRTGSPLKSSEVTALCSSLKDVIDQGAILTQFLYTQLNDLLQCLPVELMQYLCMVVMGAVYMILPSTCASERKKQAYSWSLMQVFRVATTIHQYSNQLICNILPSLYTAIIENINYLDQQLAPLVEVQELIKLHASTHSASVATESGNDSDWSSYSVIFHRQVHNHVMQFCKSIPTYPQDQSVWSESPNVGGVEMVAKNSPPSLPCSPSPNIASGCFGYKLRYPVRSCCLNISTDSDVDLLNKGSSSNNNSSISSLNMNVDSSMLHQHSKSCEEDVPSPEKTAAVPPAAVVRLSDIATCWDLSPLDSDTFSIHHIKNGLMLLYANIKSNDNKKSDLHEAILQEPVVLRPWPSIETVEKELKKLGDVAAVNGLGNISSSVAELTSLQAVHYHTTRVGMKVNARDASRVCAPDGSLNIVRPLAIATMTPTESLLQFASVKKHFHALKKIETKLSSRAEANNQQQQLRKPQQKQQQQKSLIPLRFMVLPAVHITLADIFECSRPHHKHVDEIGKTSIGNSIVPPVLALEWCRDLLMAIDHLILCGIYLKVFGSQDLFITSDGRLLLGHLNNCTTASFPETLDADSSGSHERAVMNKDQLRDLEKTISIPPSHYHLTAPEVLLGAPPSSASMTYTAAVICAKILCNGNWMIRDAGAADKQLQRTLKVLGTPRKVGFNDYSALPLAALYGSNIRNDAGKLEECKNRLVKSLRSWASNGSDDSLALLHHTFSQPLPSSQRIPSSQGNNYEEMNFYYEEYSGDSDHGGAIDMLYFMTQLAPSRRAQPLQILRELVLFQRTAVNLKEAFPAIASFILDHRLLSDRSIYTYCRPSAKDRKSMMREVVQQVRTLKAQRKDIRSEEAVEVTKMDAFLFDFAEKQLQENESCELLPVTAATAPSSTASLRKPLQYQRPPPPPLSAPPRSSPAQLATQHWLQVPFTGAPHNGSVGGQYHPQNFPYR